MRKTFNSKSGRLGGRVRVRFAPHFSEISVIRIVGWQSLSGSEDDVDEVVCYPYKSYIQINY
jgi:hypothetical protein